MARTLFDIDMRKDKTVQQAPVSLQESIDNWVKLLIVTGGAFKPPKCFYYST